MGSLMPLRCCLQLAGVNSVASRGSLPRRLLILVGELRLILTEFGAPTESVSAVLSDCFPVYICSFAGYFARFFV